MRMSSEFVPTFVCVGVGKAGTTTLHYLLLQRPDIVLVRAKEASFFNVESNYGRGMAWYRSLFGELSGQRHIGDITPGYFRSPVALLRIHRDLSSATKIIVIFRHPVARAFSHYLHDVRLLDNNRPFLEGGEVVDPSYMVKSLYADHMRLLLELFPRENILPLIFERDIANGRLLRAYAKVCGFLGIDEVKINTDVHKVPAFIPEARIIERDQDIAEASGIVKVKAGDIQLRTVLDSDSGVVTKYIHSPEEDQRQWYLRLQSDVTRKLDPEMRQKLFQRYFAEDVAELREMLNDGISEWEEEPQTKPSNPSTAQHVPS